MMDMIQRIIGFAIGVIVSAILLYFMADVGFEETIVPLVIGAVAAFFWPVVIGWYLLRRAKHRRDDKIQSEVERQVNQQNRG
jgi:nicotinamide riboside transporter PnuC